MPRGWRRLLAAFVSSVVSSRPLSWSVARESIFSEPLNIQLGSSSPVMTAFARTSFWNMSCTSPGLSDTGGEMCMVELGERLKLLGMGLHPDGTLESKSQVCHASLKF